MRKLLLAVLLTSTTTSAFAAPPPPPGYIADAAQALMMNVTPQNLEAYAAVFTDDLHVSLNGDEVAHDKVSWIAFQKSRLGELGRVLIGSLEDQDRVLVVDQYDDRSGLPAGPGMIFDSLFVTRAERYQFGRDHLVHDVRIIQGGGMPWLRGG